MTATKAIENSRFPAHANPLPPVCSIATSIKSSSSSPSFSAVSSAEMRSPSTMNRTCEAVNPRRLQYASISLRNGVDFLILNCTYTALLVLDFQLDVCSSCFIGHGGDRN